MQELVDMMGDTSDHTDQPSLSGNISLLQGHTNNTEDGNSNNNNDADYDASQPEEEEAATPDEEQLRRILQCKRLSEGCCQRYPNSTNGGPHLNRKNSLHSIMLMSQDSGAGSNCGGGGPLPPVTEGVPMLGRHNQQQQQQQQLKRNSTTIPDNNNTHSSSSSLSLRSSLSGGGGSSAAGTAFRGINGRRMSSSQDGDQTSCSSSVSLDGGGGGGKGSPTGSQLQIAIGRRRSSTVSQCSSVLSEGTRQQLNFDLSPDLPADSSILEANAVMMMLSDSPNAGGSQDCCDLHRQPRPASPEPFSPDINGGGPDDESVEEFRSESGSGAGSYQRSLEMMRPNSRMSDSREQFCFDVDDDEDNDYNNDDDMSCDVGEDANQQPQHKMHRQQHQSPDSTLGDSNKDDYSSSLTSGQSDTKPMLHQRHQQHEQQIKDNLERLISEVSTVQVTTNKSQMTDDNNNNNNINNYINHNNISTDNNRVQSNKRAHTPYGSIEDQRSKVAASAAGINNNNDNTGKINGNTIE